MKDVEDEPPDFYDQLKAFSWEMLAESVPKCNLDIVWEFYDILLMMVSLCPFYHPHSREIHSNG